jgi:uncharacterized protein YdhG (YjbR/CyaY superfamily)
MGDRQVRREEEAMQTKAEPPATVAEYIGQQDKKTQAVLKKLRTVILKNAPGAEERISYRMPAYFMKGILVYFAAWEKHIGLYPGAQAIVAFKEDLATYVHAKGSIQFPLEKPLPAGLIARIVKYRVADVQENNAKKKKGRSAAGRSGRRAT